MKPASLAAIQTDLLRQVVAVVGAVFLVGIGLFLGHGAWSGPATRRNAARLAQGQTALQSVLDGSGTAAHHRLQAAVALRSLGSPGTLFLRQALSGGDIHAAEAARHMLELPASAVRIL